MKDSWRCFCRRLAATTIISGSIAWSSALCYATQLAFDRADDPVYADGWQGITYDETGMPITAGDNGGFGFTPWDFSSSITFDGTYYGQYTDSGFHAIDDGAQGGTHYSNPFNNIGRAWDIGVSPTNNGVPRAGRGLETPLQIGQTLRIEIDNPTERAFFKGYFIKLSGGTGGMTGNLCYGGYACNQAAELPVNKMYFSQFAYGPQAGWGNWGLTDSASVSSGVLDTVTAADGAVFSVKRTGEGTYDVVLDPNGPGASYTASRTFANPAFPLDWIEFTFFNTVTDDGILGDYNNDLVVNAADYTVWRDNLGAGTAAKPFKLPHEDPNVSPGLVRADDYNVWKSRFGNTPVSPTRATDFYIRSIEIFDDVAVGAGSAASGSGVPEPSTLVYSVAAGLAGLAGLRRGKGNAHDDLAGYKR